MHMTMQECGSRRSTTPCTPDEHPGFARFSPGWRWALRHRCHRSDTSFGRLIGLLATTAVIGAAPAEAVSLQDRTYAVSFGNSLAAQSGTADQRVLNDQSFSDGLATMNLSVSGNFTLGPVTASSSATALASAAVGRNHALAAGQGEYSRLDNLSVLTLGSAEAVSTWKDTWRVGAPAAGTPELVTVR